MKPASHFPHEPREGRVVRRHQRNTVNVIISCVLAMSLLALGFVIVGRTLSSGVQSVKVTLVVPPAPKAESLPSTPKTKQRVVMAVPVVACATTLASAASTHITIPATATVSLPAQYSGYFAVFTDSEESQSVLAPKSWTCNADYGEDGSGILTVRPRGEFPVLAVVPGEEVVGISILTNGGCTGCTIKLGRRGNEVISRGNDTVTFVNPPNTLGTGYDSGGAYPSRSVITSTDVGQPSATLASCVAPPTLAAVCTVALSHTNVLR